MNYHFLTVRTDLGGIYARKILKSIEWIGEHHYPQHEFHTHDLTISEFEEAYLSGAFSHNYDVFHPQDTIIHPRAAHPYDVDWIKHLKALWTRGFTVVNPPDVLKMTSNKLKCSLLLQDKVNHPASWEYRKDMTIAQVKSLRDSIAERLGEPDYVIAKPLTSLNQGADVRKVYFGAWADNLREEFDKVPGKRIVIQEFVPYTALHRVIVIGGKALPYTFVDRVEWHQPDDWKVSCCLNRTTMRLNENASPELLALAEQTQAIVGGSVNFIDIFQYQLVSPGGVFHKTAYTIGEINTACSLNIHERLAKEAGRSDWNIHYRIARQLVKDLIGG